MDTKQFRPPNYQNPKVFIINDSRDDNARARQAGELSRYIECSHEFIRVSGELAAGFNLIDTLKTFRHGKRGGIAVNVATRTGILQNGINFGYFPFESAWVVSTTGDETLALAEYLDATKTIRVLDTEKTTDFLIAEGFVSPDDREDILTSQFRSSVFSPAVLAYLITRGEIPCYTLHQLKRVDSIIGKVCWIDNFGNLKLAKTVDSLGGIGAGTFIKTLLPAPFHRLLYYPQLSMVPDKRAAIIRGSSGVGSHRLLEVVVKGGKAGRLMKLEIGDRVLPTDKVDFVD
ncbi:MAG: hypothetical protein HYS57_01560 [Parcubacteria group bacterium]|nr:hypothetical protein [Parcubacteria group bacterium]